MHRTHFCAGCSVGCCCIYVSVFFLVFLRAARRSTRREEPSRERERERERERGGWRQLQLAAKAGGHEQSLRQPSLSFHGGYDSKVAHDLPGHDL